MIFTKQGKSKDRQTKSEVFRDMPTFQRLKESVETVSQNQGKWERTGGSGYKPGEVGKNLRSVGIDWSGGVEHNAGAPACLGSCSALLFLTLPALFQT